MEYQTKLQALTIQQQKLQLDELELANRYRADGDALTQVNKQGQDLVEEMMKTLALDSKKYTVQANGKGEIEIVLQEKK